MTYKSKETKSSFIETTNKKRENFAVDCIYKHPKVSATEFKACVRYFLKT